MCIVGSSTRVTVNTRVSGLSSPRLSFSQGFPAFLASTITFDLHPHHPCTLHHHHHIVHLKPRLVSVFCLPYSLLLRPHRRRAPPRSSSVAPPRIARCAPRLSYVSVKSSAEALSDDGPRPWSPWWRCSIWRWLAVAFSTAVNRQVRTLWIVPAAGSSSWWGERGVCELAVYVYAPCSPLLGRFLSAHVPSRPRFSNVLDDPFTPPQSPALPTPPPSVSRKPNLLYLLTTHVSGSRPSVADLALFSYHTGHFILAAQSYRLLIVITHLPCMEAVLAINKSQSTLLLSQERTWFRAKHPPPSPPPSAIPCPPGPAAATCAYAPSSPPA